MNDKETKAILGYLYSEHDKPAEAQIAVWQDQFKDIDYQEALKAARHVKANLSYAPKVADFWSSIKTLRTANMPHTLTWSVEEALQNAYSKKYLCVMARQFADRAVPAIAGHFQFSSPEEMHKAQAINRREWERAFKDKYKEIQSTAIKLISQGQDPKSVYKLITREYETRKTAITYN